jgi:hypothetical protein
VISTHQTLAFYHGTMKVPFPHVSDLRTHHSWLASISTAYLPSTSGHKSVNRDGVPTLEKVWNLHHDKQTPVPMSASSCVGASVCCTPQVLLPHIVAVSSCVVGKCKTRRGSMIDKWILTILLVFPLCGSASFKHCTYAYF